MLRMFENARAHLNRSSGLLSQRSRFLQSMLVVDQRSASSMPLLDQVVSLVKNQVHFERTAFFGIQHILGTNAPLFEHLVQDLGANPDYIFLSGKGYSDHEETCPIRKTA